MRKLLKTITEAIKEKLRTKFKEKAKKKAKKKLKKLVIKLCFAALIACCAVMVWDHRKLLLRAIIRKKLPIDKCPAKCPVKCLFCRKK